MIRKQVLRILDANFNRSREGLRVCEEIARFVMDDRKLTARLKRARHDVTDCLKKFPGPLSELLGSRDVRGDVGKEPSGLEKSRSGTLGLFSANIERAKESLRALEEASKLVEGNLSGHFKKIRFKTYAIEKEAVPKLEALRDHKRNRG